MRHTNKESRIAARIKVLEELGFTICHQDSNVEHPALPGVVFDFSATAADSFVTQALRTAHATGVKTGETNVRSQLKALIFGKEHV